MKSAPQGSDHDVLSKWVWGLSDLRTLPREFTASVTALNYLSLLFFLTRYTNNCVVRLVPEDVYYERDE